MSRHTVTCLAFLCWSIACGAAENPTIFNAIKGQRTGLDNEVHEHFEESYKVTDVNVMEHPYRNPKGISGFGPLHQSMLRVAVSPEPY